MQALSAFARLLGVPLRHAEDALHSESAARFVLSRRSVFGVAGALALGSAFSFPAPWRSEIWTSALALPSEGDGTQLRPYCFDEAVKHCVHEGATLVLMPGDYVAQKRYPGEHFNLPRLPADLVIKAALLVGKHPSEVHQFLVSIQ